MNKNALYLTIGLLAATALSTVVSAAGPLVPDLRLTLAAPSGQKVYQSGTFTYTIKNIGKKTAMGAKVVITLPSTATSPQVYMMGTLNSYSTRCTRSGLVLTCPLGNLAKDAVTTIYVDVRPPYSAAPIVLSAVASTDTPEPNQTNNTINRTLTLGTWPIAMTFDAVITHSHCTGTTLSSYFECTMFPSSISSHSATFHADGTISFPSTYGPYSGTWTLTPTENRLQFEYFESGNLVASFDGRGVGGNCVEGLVRFEPNNGYVSPYRFCF